MANEHFAVIDGVVTLSEEQLREGLRQIEEQKRAAAEREEGKSEG